MDWWNLGVGIGGLAASIVGLLFALFALLAAMSAKKAANEARDALTRTVRIVDVTRAAALISHLKLLHGVGRWDSAAELYQFLRRSLSDICESIPRENEEIRTALSEAIPKITDIENEVRRSRYGNRERVPEDISKIDSVLNNVQQNLEGLQSADTFRRR